MNPELLIAGCGYVGSALAQRELESGRRVIAMSRSPLEFPWMAGYPGQWTSLVCDFTDLEAFPKELPWLPQMGVFLVSPALRQGGDGEAYLRALHQWNEWCSRIGIRHKIMASSIGVYEQQDGSWVTEKNLLEANSPRAQRLLEAERLFLQHTEAAGETGVVLRIGGIYGPGRHRFLSGLSEETESKDYLNLIWSEDLVAAIQACAVGILKVELEGDTAAPTTLSGVYNVTDGAPAPRKQIVDFVRKLSPPSQDTEVPIRPSRTPRGNTNRRIDPGHFQNTFGWQPSVKNYQEGYQKLKEIRNLP